MSLQEIYATKRYEALPALLPCLTKDDYQLVYRIYMDLRRIADKELCLALENLPIFSSNELAYFAREQGVEMYCLLVPIPQHPNGRYCRTVIASDDILMFEQLEEAIRREFNFGNVMEIIIQHCSLKIFAYLVSAKDTARNYMRVLINDIAREGQIKGKSADFYRFLRQEYDFEDFILEQFIAWFNDEKQVLLRFLLGEGLIFTQVQLATLRARDESLYSMLFREDV